MPRGHCVKLLDPIVPPATNLEEFITNPTLEANTPDANSRGQWAVLAEPIPALLYGWAWVAGIHAAQVRVLDPSHEYVDAIPATGSTIHLATDTAGSARIIWPSGMPRAAAAGPEERRSRFTLVNGGRA